MTGNADSAFAHRYVIEHGPTHLDDLARAFALSLSKQRAGKLLKKRLKQAVLRAKKLSQVEVRGDFVWPPPGTWQAQEAPPANTGKVLYRIPPQQVANAACDVMHQQLPDSFEELVTRTIRALGFKRVAKKSYSYVENLLRDLHIDRDFERNSAPPELVTAPSPATAPTPAPALAALAPSAVATPSATTRRTEPISSTPVAPPAPDANPAQVTTPVAPPSTPHAALIAAAVARCPPDVAGELTAVLRLLLPSAGRAGADKLAREAGVPRFRVPGLIAKLGEHLHRDVTGGQRDVLRFDHAAQEAVLEVTQLRQVLSTSQR